MIKKKTTGGVTSMDTFLLDFFPHVYEKKHRVHENNYCKFDDQLLQLFTSSLYLAGIFASFAASFLCRRFGRKPIIMSASIFFLLGAILNYFARDLGMLIGGIESNSYLKLKLLLIITQCFRKYLKTKASHTLRLCYTLAPYIYLSIS